LTRLAFDFPNETSGQDLPVRLTRQRLNQHFAAAHGMGRGKFVSKLPLACKRATAGQSGAPSLQAATRMRPFRLQGEA